MHDDSGGGPDPDGGGPDPDRGAPRRARPAPGRVTIRVTQSGEVAVAGLSRFPITLKKAQWERLLSMEGEIRAFIAAHQGELLPDT